MTTKRQLEDQIMKKRQEVMQAIQRYGAKDPRVLKVKDEERKLLEKYREVSG